ncbi:MAG: tetratricopeptide repeat protein [Vulcanimicrobiota bacterium]
MPDNALALMNEAEEARKNKEWDLAIEKYNQVLEEDPQNEEACSKLAQMYAMRGLISEVIQQYFIMIDILEQKEEYDLAVEVAEWIMKLQPENDKARMKIILIYKEKGDMEEVVNQSLELARLYIELGQGDQSILLLKNAQEIAPDNLDIGLELAEIYISYGQIQEGTNQYRKIANAYLNQGNMEKAAEAFRRMKIIVSDDPQLLFTLGNLYMQLGKYDDAENEFRAILRLNLNHTEALMALGQVCQKKGQFRDAILAFSKIMSLDPQNEIAKERLGELYQAQGATGEAVKYYLQAASAHQYGDNVDKAIRLYQRVLKIDPTNPTACRELTNLGAPLEPEDDSDEEAYSPEIGQLDIEEGELEFAGPSSLEEMAGAEAPEEPEMPETGPLDGEETSMPGQQRGLKKDIRDFRHNVGDDLQFTGEDSGQSDILLDAEMQQDQEAGSRRGLTRKGLSGGGVLAGRGSSLRKGLSKKKTSKLGGGLRSKSLGGKRMGKRGGLGKKPAGLLSKRRTLKKEKPENEPVVVSEEIEEQEMVVEENFTEDMPAQNAELTEELQVGEEELKVSQEYEYDKELQQEADMEVPHSGAYDMPVTEGGIEPEEEIPEMESQESAEGDLEIGMAAFPEEGEFDMEDLPDLEGMDDLDSLEQQAGIDLDVGMGQEFQISEDEEIQIEPISLEETQSEPEEEMEIELELPDIEDMQTAINTEPDLDEAALPDVEEKPEEKKKYSSGLLGRKKKSLNAVFKEEEPGKDEIPEIELSGLDTGDEVSGLSGEEISEIGGLDEELDISALEIEDEIPLSGEILEEGEIAELPELNIEMGSDEELPSLEIPEEDISELADSSGLNISSGEEEISTLPGELEMEVPEIELSENELGEAMDEITSREAIEISADNVLELEGIEEEFPDLETEAKIEPIPDVPESEAGVQLPSQEQGDEMDMGDLFGGSDDEFGGFGDLLRLAEEIENIIPDEERIREAEERKKEEDEKASVEKPESSEDFELEEMHTPTMLLDSKGMTAPATVMLPDLPGLFSQEDETGEEGVVVATTEEFLENEQADAEETVTTEVEMPVPDVEQGETMLPPTRILEGIASAPEIEIAEEVATENFEEIPGPFPEPEESIEEKITNLLEEGNLGKVFPLFQEYLEDNSDNREKLLEYAELSYKYGLLDEASRSYSKLFDQDSSDTEILKKLIKCQLIAENIEDAVVSLVKLGDQLTGAEQPDEAQRIYQHVLALDEDNSFAREALAEIYLKQEMNQLALYHLNILARHLEAQEKIDSTIDVLKKIYTLTTELEVQEKLASVYVDYDYREEAITELKLLSQRYIQNDDFVNAVDKLKKVVEIVTDDLEAHKKLVNLYEKLDDMESAYEEKVIVGNLLFNNNEYKEARQWYENCLDYKGYDYKVRHKLVEIYLELDKIDKAQEGIKVLSEVYHKDRKYDEAIELYQKFLEKSPDNLSMRDRLAEFYVLAEKFDKGLEQLKIVAETLVEKEDWDDAIKMYRKALTIDENNPELHFRIGKIYLEHKNNVTEARYEFDKVYSIDSSHKQAMEHLVKLYLQEERPSKAISILLELIQKDDSYEDLKKNIIDDYKSRIAEDTKDYKAHFHLGIIYKELKKWKQAIEQFQTTRKSKDYVLESHNMLGICFAQQPSMVSLAIKTLEKGIKLKGFEKKDYIDLHYNLGKLYQGIKKYEKAADEFQAILTLDSHYKDTVDLLKEVKKNISG